MWTRAELKSLAKSSLKDNYWKAFLVALVLSLFSGTGGGGNSGGARDTASEYVSNHPDTLIIVIALIILAIAYRLLLGYSLEVGSRKYFVQLGQFKNTEKCYSFAFDGSNYKGIISTMLLKGVYNFLWSLLFIIPGIIKSYSYRMVPYILADNPNIGADKAITLSRRMMDGHKFNTFVLELSFFGWYLLGLLVFVVGILFVNPYAFATDAQLYLVLRRNALECGFCTYDDLNLQRDINDFNDFNNFSDFNNSNINNYYNRNNYKSDDDYFKRDDN